MPAASALDFRPDAPAFLRDPFPTFRRLREADPVVVFSYYNPILAYGAAAFHRDACKAGADGVLVVDLPPEESAELTDLWPDRGLCLIRLTAPTTPPQRVRRIADAASGFIYHVSHLGVTGGSGLRTDAIAVKLQDLRVVTRLTVWVGFGISTPDQVAAVARMAEGVVVGSAFERLIEENIARPDLPEILAGRVAELKRATHCRRRRGANRQPAAVDFLDDVGLSSGEAEPHLS